MALPRKPRGKRKALSEAGTAREAASAAGGPAVHSVTAKRRRRLAADPVGGGAREGSEGLQSAADVLGVESGEVPGFSGSWCGVAPGQEQRTEGDVCAGGTSGSRKPRKIKAAAEMAQLAARPKEPGSVVGGLAPPAPRPATQGPAAHPAQKRAAGKSRQRAAESGADGAGRAVCSNAGPPEAAAGAPSGSAAAANPAEDPAPGNTTPLAPRAAAPHPLAHPRKPGKRNKFKPWAGAGAAAPDALPLAGTASGAAAKSSAAIVDGAAARLPDAIMGNGVATEASAARVTSGRKGQKAQGLAQPEGPGPEIAGKDARRLLGRKTVAGRSVAGASGLGTPRQGDPGSSGETARLVNQTARSEQAAAWKGANPDPESGPGLLGEMRARLAGGRFRWLNERLYTAPSAEALALMQAQPELFEQYHEVRR